MSFRAISSVFFSSMILIQKKYCNVQKCLWNDEDSAVLRECSRVISSVNSRMTRVHRITFEL